MIEQIDRVARHLLRQGRRLGASVLALSELTVGLPLDVRRIEPSDTKARDEARRLATSIFLEYGKLDPTTIDTETGLPAHDQYLDKKTFYGAYWRGRLLATMFCLGDAQTVVDDLRMPVDELPRDSAETLRRFSPGSIAEIGGFAHSMDALGKFAGRAAGLSLTRALVMDGIDRGVQAFVAGIEPKVAEAYGKQYFGGVVKRLSRDAVEFTKAGVIGPQVPTLFHFGENIATAKKRQRTGGHNSIGGQALLYIIGRYFDRYKSLPPHN